jgi:predicted DNA-binding ribbon-helix-helix protein
MITKRSIIIEGKVTSVCMEPAFWEEIDRRAELNNLPWQDYMRRLLSGVHDVPNRSAALRETLLRQLVAENLLGRGQQLASWWLLKTPGGSREAGARGVRLFVGRHASCDIVVDDREVSRRHLMLAFDGDSWWGIDLESKNGLWSGRKKVPLVKLARGATVRIGDSELSYLGSR